MIPKSAELEAGIKSGGILILEEDGVRATLNVVIVESKSSSPGTAPMGDLWELLDEKTCVATIEKAFDSGIRIEVMRAM